MAKRTQYERKNVLMAERELTPREALCYLDDIAHGRKMEYDPHVLKRIVENGLKSGEEEKAFEILKIIYDHPFALEVLYHTGGLGKRAEYRYIWTVISDEEVIKLKEFFSDGEKFSHGK